MESYDFDTWSLVSCAMPKCAVMSAHISSRVSSVNLSVLVLYMHVYKCAHK